MKFNAKTKLRSRDFLIGSILLIIALNGQISPQMTNRLIIKLIKKLKTRRATSKYRQEYYINRKTKELITQKLIKIDPSGHLELTKDGEKRLAKIQQVNKYQNYVWDKKWRMVIFDIPEKQKLKRDLLRRELIETGFKKLQHSVWVSPYPQEEFIELLKTEIEINHLVIYLETDRLSNEHDLRKSFGLKSV
ncbi:hypothetical protein BK005_01420 [bacterium CG10_37_50]|nr:MAG: hypothetical protein BK005_01420 [bacterium CG10_37_50]